MTLQVADQTNLHYLILKCSFLCFTGARDYSFTDIIGQFISGQLEVQFSISTDSVALEGSETFSISATLLDTIASIAPAANEFVADPFIVKIQDVNGTDHE